jgi:hypothetical protein
MHESHIRNCICLGDDDRFLAWDGISAFTLSTKSSTEIGFRIIAGGFLYY